MNKLPKARTSDLVEQNLDKETLLYDLITDKAFNLNETSTIVYKSCNGSTTFEELKRKHKFTDDFIFLALDELKRHNLLAENIDYVSPFYGVNRREVIRKVGLATMIVLPVISGLIAPKAINAASAADPNIDRNIGESCTIGITQCNDAPNGLAAFCTNGRCCSGNAQGTLNPGETFNTGGTFISVPAVNGSCDQTGTNFCQNLCCNSDPGAIPTGVCSTVLTAEDDDGNIVSCLYSDCPCTC